VRASTIKTGGEILGGVVTQAEIKTRKSENTTESVTTRTKFYDRKTVSDYSIWRYINRCDVRQSCHVGDMVILAQ
jgi:hypothetical protein